MKLSPKQKEVKDRIKVLKKELYIGDKVREEIPLLDRIILFEQINTLKNTLKIK